MKILCFDTETTDLIKAHNNSKFHILQLSWIVHDTETLTEEENNFVLDVPLKKITNSWIHRITKEISQKGYYFSEIIDIFLHDVDQCDILIGYNLIFDLNALEIELSKLNMWDQIDMIYSKRFSDPMKNYSSLYNCKYIKLTDMYLQFFGEQLKGAHDAIVDVRATLRVHLELKIISSV
tara:strand:+ start:3525 stop:4061 length:537 start_codon:yes stop_codon:yes gene_type:complete